MFKYINMPKLVAFYLREFSFKTVEGDEVEEGYKIVATTLYRFIFCLCLPFVSATFRDARLTALMIAECTNSEDQIKRVLKAITGADITVETPFNSEFMIAYDVDTDTMLPFDPRLAPEDPNIPYSAVANDSAFGIKLNGASQELVESYLSLLVPFYVNYKITYTN